jgi:hypothetical protein
VVPSGSVAVAIDIDPVHTDRNPRVQYSQRPHAGFGLSTTWSPTASESTPGPTSTTTPAAS